MNDELVYIPSNYTDAGKIFGMFEVRNVVEAVLFCVPAGLLVLLCSPFDLTVTITIAAILLVPAGGFSLIGVQDYSLLVFLRIYLTWRKNRRVIVYRQTPEETKRFGKGGPKRKGGIYHV